MKEDIIRIRCLKCDETKLVNKMLWKDGKQFTCSVCGMKRFVRVR